MGNKPELHELLAVGPDLKGKAAQEIATMEVTFDKRTEHFTGLEKSYEPFEEAEKHLAGVEDRREVATTVFDKISYVMNIVAQDISCVAQTDGTNQVARADLVLSGETLATGVPATTLLFLERKYLPRLRKAWEGIPTLAPGKKWELDPAAGDHIFKMSNPEENFRTKKDLIHKILVPPTERHPAQIEKWTEDKKIGKLTTNYWSGQISVAKKAQLLGFVDRLSTAVKRARSQANKAEVVKSDLGKVITDKILEVLSVD